MASDAQINIDIILNNLSKFKSDANLIDDILSDIGNKTGDKMDDAFATSAGKVQDEAKATEKTVDESLGKEVTTQLMADDTDVSDKTASVKSELEEIPDESETSLTANSEDLSSKVGDAKSDIETMPEESETSLTANAQDISEKTADAKSGLDKIPESTETEIKANAEDAKRDAGEVQSAFWKIPIRKTTRLDADAEDAKRDTGEVQSGYNKIPDKKSTRLDVDAQDAVADTRQLGNEASRSEGKFSRLKDKLSIGAIAGAASAGFQMITGSVGDLIGETIEASDSIQGFQSTMEFADFGEKKIQKTQKAMKSYADNTVYDLETVSNTTAQLGANGVKDFEKLMEASGNLNAVAGGTQDTFKSLSMMMTQTAGAGKLTTENWNQLADAIPGASGKMQEAMKKNGAYTGNFRDAMEEGEISADEFFQAIMQLGDTKKAAEYARGTAAYEGAIGNLKSSITNGMLEIEERIGKSRITDLINGMADGVVQLFGKVGDFFNYLDEHSDAVKGIGKNLKTILGTLGSSIWNTSVDIIMSIAEMFGLVDENTKELDDPLEKVESILKKIADNKDGIESVGKAIVGMFVVKKAMKFAGALGEVYGALTNISKVKMPGFLAGGAGGATGMAGAAASLGKIVPALGVVASIPELFKKGSGGAKGGGFLGGSGGAIGGAKAGAAIGTAIAPGIGTAIGTVLGGVAGQKIGSKAGRAIGGGVQSWWKKNFKPLSAKVKPSVGQLDSKKISKKLKPSVKKINEAILIKMGVDSKSAKKAEKETKKYFNKIYDEIDDYYNKKEKRSKKNLDKLVEAGVITQKQADKMLKKQKKNDNKEKKSKKNAYSTMEKNLKNHTNKLEEIENDSSKSIGKKKKATVRENKRYNRQYVFDTFNANKQINKDVSKGAEQQKDTLENLRKRKGKISNMELGAIQVNSNKQYKTATKSARDTYNNVVKSANKKYKETTDAAEKEYKENGTLSKKQYDKVVKDAGKQRDGTKDAAMQQYKHATKSARDQHKKVTDEIGSQKSGVIKRAKEQKTGHKNASDQEMKDVNKNYKNGFAETKGIWNGLLDPLNGILNFFKKGAGAIPLMPGVPKHARGSSGLSNDEVALVGEEGFELAHDEKRGVYPIGVNGPEIRPLEAGTSILPHSKSREFLAMTKGLPAHKDGVWGKISGAYNWVKDKLKDAEEWAMDGAKGIYDQIADKIGLKNFVDSFDNKPTHSVPIKGGTKLIKDSLIDYAQKFLDEFTGGGEFDGKMGSHGVYKYLVDIAKKVMKKFPGMSITSGYRPGDPNHHGKHQAIDIAYPASMNGSKKYFDPANYAFNTFPNEIAYVITQRRVKDRVGSSGHGPSKHWMNWGSSDHDDHLHLSGKYGPGDVGKGGAGGNVGKVKGSWETAVKRALKANGLPTTGAYVNAWLKQIQSESGGNAKAIGGTDGLADGRATGLLQTKPGTFKAYAFSGHKNIMNGYDNMLAAIAYAKATYGKTGMLKVIGHGHGYANGGEVNGPELAWIGEDPSASHEYIINPKKDSADALISKAIASREQFKPAASTNVNRYISSGSQHKTSSDTPRKIHLEVPVYLSKNAPRELGYATAEYVEEKNNNKATVKKLLEGRR